MPLAPGADEDKQGEPFVGLAGQLLTKIIETMGYARSEVYIGNVLKCRPDMPPGESGNRKPKLEEMQTCLPYLRQQIEIIQQLSAGGFVEYHGEFYDLPAVKICPTPTEKPVTVPPLTCTTALGLYFVISSGGRPEPWTWKCWVSQPATLARY